MEITVENTKGLAKQEDKLKTYAQTTMKGAMPAPKIAPSATGMLRTAGLSKQAYFDTTTQPTFWYSPELTQTSWLLPKSRVETLRFCQIYYNLNPYVNSIINLHTQYGFSPFTLQYKDPNITELFNKLLTYNQDFDWYQFTLDVALSYFKYGEAVCLTGDTKIRLLDGTTKTLKELHDQEAKDFWVYSIDASGNIVPGKADCVVLTKKNAKVLKVTLDNGKSFKCTPNHKCLLRNGTYVEAQELKAGDALMPLYTKQAKVYRKGGYSRNTYEMVYNPGIATTEQDATGNWLYTHRIVSKHTCGDIKHGIVVHHKDFNKNNNSPENLQQMTIQEHVEYHGSLTHKHTDLTKKILSDKAKERYLKNPEEVMRRLKKATENAAIANRGRKYTEERLALQRANAKRIYSTPEGREKQRARSRAYWDKKHAEYKNHKVVSVVECGAEDVYDIRSVDTYHNFALDCGVFVHNCWGDWDAARRTWRRFTLLNPAIVDYKEDMVTGHATIELIPTNEMKKVVKDAIIQGRRDIDPLLLDAIENNKKLPLDTEGIPENVFTGQEYIPPKVFMFQRKTDPASERGTSMIQCLFQDLIYQDQIRMAQFAVAQKTQLPIELWTVGHIGNDDASSMLPGPELLEEVRQMITQATQQPPFSIVYGPYLKYEALGVSGKLLDIYNDLGYVENQILVGLNVNKAVILGEGPSVQGKAISLNRLVRFYQVTRDLFSNWFKRNILLPIAKANHLVDENGQYIVPNIVWELSLQPEQDKERFDLFYKMWKDGLISTMTLFEHCPEKVDYNLEMKRLVEERGSIFDKKDRRLPSLDGKSSPGGSKSALDTASEKGVEAGKGNEALRDFALGGEDSAELEGLDTEVGSSTEQPAETPTEGA